jgi:hypothetical protein
MLLRMIIMMMMMMMTIIITIIQSENRRETKIQELNYSFMTPTTAPSIAATCFGATPSSGISTPRFKTYYSIINHKSNSHYTAVF